MVGLGSFLRRALCACVLAFSAADAGAQIAPSAPQLNFLPGHYLVRQKPGVTQQQCLEDLRARAGGAVELVQALPDRGLLHVKVETPAPGPAAGAANLASVQHSGGAALASSDNVARVEPVVQYRLAQTATDPAQAAQAIRVVLERMRVAPAWDAPPDGEPVIVAVIDTGVFLEHEMFEGLLLPGYDATRDLPDGSAQRLPSGAIEDHGTRVAGMIAAMARATPSGEPGPLSNIRILPIRATSLAPNGGQVVLTPDGIEAIDYAVSRGARVINISWGEGVPSEELREAIRRANDQGAVVIAAAGNGRNVGLTRAGYDIDAEPFYPASYKLPNIIGVAAVNADDVLAPWSNWGKTAVEITAPGESVMTAVPFFDPSSNGPRSGYAPGSGTSFAAPLTAGATALLMAAHPNFKPHEIVSLMTRGVDSLAPLATRVSSGGRLNMNVLISKAAPEYAVIPPENRPPAAEIGGPETRTDNEKIPVDIRAYVDHVTGGGVSPTIEAPPNRIRLLVRMKWGRDPQEVLDGLADTRTVEVKRNGLVFYRNHYTVTLETERAEAEMIDAIKGLDGVESAEPVQAYQLLGD